MVFKGLLLLKFLSSHVWNRQSVIKTTDKPREVRVMYITGRLFCSCSIGRQTRYCGSSPIANVQKYHCTAAPMSSAVAPIIWSIINGTCSMFVKMLPRPKGAINCDTHNMIIAAICVQLIMNYEFIMNSYEKPISIFHASKSSRPRGNGWKHLVMVVNSRYGTCTAIMWYYNTVCNCNCHLFSLSDSMHFQIWHLCCAAVTSR